MCIYQLYFRKCCRINIDLWKAITNEIFHISISRTHLMYTTKYNRAIPICGTIFKTFDEDTK